MTRAFSSTPEFNALALTRSLSGSADEAIDVAMHYATEVDKQLTPGEAAALGAAIVLRGLSRSFKDATITPAELSPADLQARHAGSVASVRRAKPDGTSDFSEVDSGTEAEIRMDERRRIVGALRVKARHYPGPQGDEIATIAAQIELGGI
jgi:hypothetical protein